MSTLAAVPSVTAGRRGARSAPKTTAQRLRECLDESVKTRALLKRAPQLVESLAACIARLKRSRRLHRATILAARWRMKGAVLARAVNTVEKLVSDPKLAPLLQDVVVSPQGPRLSTRRVDDALRALALLREKADTIAKLGPQPGVGAPVDHVRIRFGREVAVELRSAGVKLTKARDGVFAAVLKSALYVAGEKRTEDPFRLMKCAVDSLSARQVR